MLNILSSFIIDFLCTLSLFIFSLIMVLGIKVLILIIKDSILKPIRIAPKSTDTNELPKPKKTKKPRSSAPKKSPVIHSIEIDPEHIDKIYVKKSS